jgi:hypothetical protein
LINLFIRRDAAHFEDDRFSHQERQRRSAIEQARPWRRALNWYLKIGVPAKILVTTAAVTVAYTVFVFGYVVEIILFTIIGR